ncbi:8-amino-7-oxononanoate synthase [Mesocricetibacter intestinalis]|uniref:8-amino-7-oxononanoate synthase n=1 Tax=Mesocricetibacter intestinalis TaxID=1521930 RepID=A0A4R6VCL8_9PAST|nr:8-amino-7-oxononanoate synthase [Mesocricetibacter intestinalis]TDQ58033.1 8-amino-7-oxononanoate synthase [Mesocricetibacter intestinalis]
MSNPDFSDFARSLAQLEHKGRLRSIPILQHRGGHIEKDGRIMLNMSSNDYLGLAADQQLRDEFLAIYDRNPPPFTSSSSRLLTGTFPHYQALEELIATRFQRQSCLLFNSGYHANIGILPALADKQTLIVADKLVHASIIDGIRLSACDFLRYRHNDYEHLQQLIEKHHQAFKRIIVVTESLFSMDGDICDLPRLTALKRRYGNIMLYVDEAHAIGAYGETGLGLAQQLGCIEEIDILVGTFGKALASMGAYAVCDRLLRDYLINFMRPLIYSTALPPFNIAWTYFLFERLPQFSRRRHHLHELSAYLRKGLSTLPGCTMPSRSYIVPYILGDDPLTLQTAAQLQQQGYYCLPIRPPTVPQGTSRIRFSLSADMSFAETEKLVRILHETHSSLPHNND